MLRLMNRLDTHLYVGVGRWYDTINRVYDSYMGIPKINNLRDMLDREHPKRQYLILKYSSYMLTEKTAEELVGRMSSYTSMCFVKADPSLERTTDQVHLLTNYVSASFKGRSDMDINDYVVKIHMEHVAGLLSVTNFRTYKIAERVGYTNSQHFSVLLKKFYDTAPKEYRSQNEVQP